MNSKHRISFGLGPSWALTRAWTHGLIAPLMAFLSATLVGASFAVAADLDLRRHEGEVRKFERQDATNPPPVGAILFTGSSSVVRWAGLTHDFPGLPVVNRGFGGSTWRELNLYFPRVVARYQPRAVVVYEGDNDLADGRSVAECLADFAEFRRLMKIHLPGVPVAVLSVKASPSRRAQRAAQDQLNAAIRGQLAGQAGWTFLDVGGVLLGPTGEPRPELFEADQLHLKRDGYRLWVPVVRPWAEVFRVP